MGRRLLQITLAALSLLISLLLIEVAFDLYQRREVTRSDAPAEPFYSWSFHTSDGKRIGRAGYLKLAMHPSAVYVNLPNQETEYFSTDARGWRRSDRAERDGHDHSVIVVGGSTAFGTGLGNDGETFAAQLEASMDGVHAINAAVIGHLSGQELSYVVSDLIDVNPDLVIALDGFNDLIDQIGGPRRTPSTMGVNNTFLLMEDRLRRLYVMESGNVLARATASVPLVFKNISRGLGTVAVPGSSVPQAGEEATSRDARTLARVYARNMAKMRTIVEAFGGRFLCVLQPDRSSFSGAGDVDDLARSYGRFRGHVSRLLVEADVSHIDLNEYSDRFDTGMFMDRMHLDARGNRAMAEVVRGAIEERGLLEERGSLDERG